MPCQQRKRRGFACFMQAKRYVAGKPLLVHVKQLNYIAPSFFFGATRFLSYNRWTIKFRRQCAWKSTAKSEHRLPLVVQHLRWRLVPATPCLWKLRSPCTREENRRPHPEKHTRPLLRAPSIQYTSKGQHSMRRDKNAQRAYIGQDPHLLPAVASRDWHLRSAAQHHLRQEHVLLLVQHEPESAQYSSTVERRTGNLGRQQQKKTESGATKPSCTKTK